MKQLFVIIATTVVALSGCHSKKTASAGDNVVSIDLDSIARRGKIRVVTDYNSVDYFFYKGTAIGYQYELITEYANHLGLELELTASNETEQNVSRLIGGQYDILATSLIADTANEKRFDFSEPYGRSRLILVQPNGKDKITVVDSLANDTVSVLANSFYLNTIKNINDTTQLNIRIDEIEHYDTEQLIQLVAEQEIKYTVSLENIARANKWFYPNIDIAVPITDEYDLAWGIRHTSPQLKDDIDNWFADFKKTPRFKQIYRKYFIDPRDHHTDVQKVTSDTYQNTYESLIRRIAVDERYNWKLISSVIYQESHFNAQARSWAGACGLMQLMPETAARFGVDDPTDPEQNIKAGYKFLIWLDNRFAELVPDSVERVKFTLAAYNVGIGHMMDAIRLAEKVNLNTHLWYNNVESALLLKSNPSFYADPVVKHGFCRGTETINYVRNIMDRYYNYNKEITGSEPTDTEENSDTGTSETPDSAPPDSTDVKAEN